MSYNASYVGYNVFAEKVVDGEIIDFWNVALIKYKLHYLNV